MAMKMEQDSTVTVGFLYKFNHWGYDIQLLGGELKGSDVFAGAGWSGSLGGAGFDGEITYIRPIADIGSAQGHLLATVGGSYSFANSLSLQGEVFYNGFATDSSNIDFYSYYYRPLDIKNLSFSKYSAFAQVSYPVTPLLSVSLAAMLLIVCLNGLIVFGLVPFILTYIFRWLVRKSNTISTKTC